jgi:hypothetical protein
MSQVRVRLSTDSVTESRTGTDLGREGLICGESCPREVGQRTLKRMNGWKRIVGVRGGDWW